MMLTLSLTHARCCGHLLAGYGTGQLQVLDYGEWFGYACVHVFVAIPILVPVLVAIPILVPVLVAIPIIIPVLVTIPIIVMIIVRCLLAPIAGCLCAPYNPPPVIPLCIQPRAHTIGIAAPQGTCEHVCQPYIYPYL